DNEGKRLDIGVASVHVGYDETAGHDVYRLDFSGVSGPGIYHIESEEGERSATFKVEPHVYKTLKNSLLKAFYFRRCGCELPRRYAGPFERGICHTGTFRFFGTDEVCSLHKGWHDAGDFGRYSSAGAVALAHMLYAYELFPEAFCEEVNIPESGNGIPDILNECRYELEFLCDMQDEDGGVHHKATPMVFCGYVMPEEETGDQFVFPVTSMSTADFAAVMCIASRVYEKNDPAFARDCMHRAYMAGQWLIAHPDNTDFHNPEGCITGEYTDESDTDERMWAYAELMRTDYEAGNKNDRSMLAAAAQRESRQDKYARHFIEALDKYTENHPHTDGRSTDDGFGWQDVSALAAVAVIFDPLNNAGEELRERMTDMLKERADAFVEMQEEGYPLSMLRQDFIWGSNMVVSNRADILILAGLALQHKLDLAERGIRVDTVHNIKAVQLSYHEKKDGKEAGALSEQEKNAIQLDMEVYEEAALNQIHYILGMNAMNISYVTGFGDHAFKNPHNRVTVADKVGSPIPGEVSGGPCTLLADEEIEQYVDKDTPPQKCYADHHMSYSTNEVAVYWNSSLLFSVAYFDR
ncbi:MAG: glycoside hydrolase family 9 protein, partial [Lachnospiraceae bacterium]|nr:glycoside hydrolase family 9 protein [Lachnospiraceae bacterium]